jgi:aspartyl-tRNA(Asn)/glutamyl-tRNA(Gln) amidotransferase subunit A
MQRSSAVTATDEIAFMSASELVRRYADGSLSPVEAAKAAISRIEAHNEKINAFALVDRERALRTAGESETRWRRKEPLGPIDGVPLSVKDTLMVKGYPFRRGSRATATDPVKESAPIVDRAFEAGGIMLGITTTPEFGAGPITISPLTGITRNPWDLDKNSGGSSGGAAASIAAGMGQIALATDAGGSIRIPSALCGVVGLKVTGGRLSTYPPNVAGTLSSPGPITRSVEDTALALSAISNVDIRDVDALPPEADTDYVRSISGGIKGLRVAFTTTLGYAAKVHPEIIAAVRRAAKQFEALGATVEETHPDVKNPIDFFLTLFRSGFAYSVRNFTPDQFALIGDQLRDVVEHGRNVTALEYLSAQDQRRALARAFQSFFQDYDLLLSPTCAVPAFTADRWTPEDFAEFEDSRAWTPFGYPFNMTQQPAISVPCGFTEAGLPIGLQIIGPRFADRLILRAAKAYETHSPSQGSRIPF